VNAVARLIADGKLEVRQSDLVGLLKLGARSFAQFGGSERPAVFPARSRGTLAK
jgi:hypothetical protein